MHHLNYISLVKNFCLIRVHCGRMVYIPQTRGGKDDVYIVARGKGGEWSQRTRLSRVEGVAMQAHPCVTSAIKMWD